MKEGWYIYLELERRIGDVAILSNYADKDAIYKTLDDVEIAMNKLRLWLTVNGYDPDGPKEK